MLIQMLKDGEGMPITLMAGEEHWVMDMVTIMHVDGLIMVMVMATEIMVILIMVIMVMGATTVDIIHGLQILICLPWEREISEKCINQLNRLIQYTSIWTQSLSLYKKESKEEVI